MIGREEGRSPIPIPIGGRGPIPEAPIPEGPNPTPIGWTEGPIPTPIEESDRSGERERKG